MWVILVIVGVELLVVALGKSYEYIRKPIMAGEADGVEEYKRRKKKMGAIGGGAAGVVILAICLSVLFSPMARFQSAMKGGRFQSAQSIYNGMSEDQKNVAGNWLTAQFGVMGEYYEVSLKGGYLDQE